MILSYLLLSLSLNLTKTAQMFGDFRMILPFLYDPVCVTHSVPYFQAFIG
jgi:hypothetical protein